jgi:DNA-binding transcriptional LysR family regulator
MDKLRALQYFAAAAADRSMSAAARRLGVSTPAIAKMITALERSLGTVLFARTVRGLALTADGESYLEACQPALAQLAAADEAVGGSVTRYRGTVVIGTPPYIGQHCILPALSAFHARYPEIQVDIRVMQLLAEDPARLAGAVDVFVLHGWQEEADFVRRRLAQNRLLVCASPAYWAAHGVPRRPRDLERHPCVLWRNVAGTVLDLWKFERGGETESVKVSGWLVTDHRDAMLDATLAGDCVARLADLTSREALRSGRVVPVLLDWEALDAPRIDLFYRPAHRRIPRVRLVIDFLTALFRDLEAERARDIAPPPPTDRPSWMRRRLRRTSAAGRGSG